MISLSVQYFSQSHLLENDARLHFDYPVFVSSLSVTIKMHSSEGKKNFSLQDLTCPKSIPWQLASGCLCVA